MLAQSHLTITHDVYRRIEDAEHPLNSWRKSA